ncbi:MAG: nucleotide pyrophosphohydrolase [Gemmataceae bacterium]
MADATTTVASLRDAMRQFVAERQWERFHSPKNLVMALAAEAAELLEHFLWVDNAESERMVQEPAKRRAVADEMADVAGCLFSLCNALDLDLSDAINDKMARNKDKYPVEQYRGRASLDA